METKKPRRRIIDSTCVPKARRHSSRGSGPSNSNGDSGSTGSDFTPKYEDITTNVDAINKQPHDLYENEREKNKTNSRNRHNMDDVISALFDNVYSTTEYTESKIDEFFTKRELNTVDISSSNTMSNGDMTAAFDETRPASPDKLSDTKEQPIDDYLDEPVFGSGSEASKGAVQDCAIDNLEDLAEISNEDLITELGLDDDNETCNHFRKFFRPSRISTNNIADIPGDCGDTLICRKHPGLFENARKSSIEKFPFSIEFTCEPNTHDVEKPSRELVEAGTIPSESTIERKYVHESESELLFEDSKDQHHVDKQVNVATTMIERKDPFLVELELTQSANMEYDGDCEDTDDLYEKDLFRPSGNNSILEQVALRLDRLTEMDECGESEDVYTAHMDGPDGTPRLLSVEEKWQIIFNEKTRAPIYAVTQYVGYLKQFINGSDGDPKKSSDVIKKDGIHPISYLLRKLKLDLKMSYDSFIEEFIKPENNGMTLLVKLLKSIQNTGTKQSGSTNMTQLKHYKKTLTDEHDCLLCIKYSLRIKKALGYLFDMNYGLETVAMGVISTFTKSRGTAIEILTLALSTDEGFSRILDCFTYIQLKIGEPVRFKSLINMTNLDSHQNTIFKVSTMKFLNSLLDASPNMNIRVYLQHEIQTAGLDITYIQQKAVGTGLEFDDLRRELDLWKRRYIDVDVLMSGKPSVTRTIPDYTERVKIEELQTQVKKLSADKAYLEYQLKSVGEELKKRYVELETRNSSRVDKSTQCHRRSTRVRNVGCQCETSDSTNNNIDPMKTAAQFFGWKDVFINEDVTNSNEHYVTNANGQTYYPVFEAVSQTDDTESNISREVTTSDEEGVVKVKYWLRSNYGSSESDLNAPTDGRQKFYFSRNSSSRRRVSGRTNFPGNWRLIPKSIEQFPSRFPPHQCHKTYCDRCDVRYRPENADQCHHFVQSVAVDADTNGNVDSVKQTDVKSSQSSDSAIGGSGDRLWNERKIALLPATDTEAELLQDLIQPDDSASRCPDTEPEPFPDYSSVNSRYNTQKSYRTELSKVLREFEGELLEFDRPVKSTVESVEHYITLGEV